MIATWLLSVVPDGMMCFWEGSSPPSGYEHVTDFDGRFPRGCPLDSVGVTGGSETHTHYEVLGLGPPDYLEDHGDGWFQWGAAAATADHTHDLPIDVPSASNLPPYRDLMVIRKIGDEPNLPAGVILMFDSDPGPGWQVILVDSFPRGSATPGGTGGSLTHNHGDGSFSGQSGPPSDYLTFWIDYPVSAGSSPWHYHYFNGRLLPAEHLPPYRTVVFAKRLSDTTDVPVGAIAMFDKDPGEEWEEVLDLDLEFRFPRGHASLGGIEGGAEKHAHGLSSFGMGPAQNECGTGTTDYGYTVAGCTYNKHLHYFDLNQMRSDSASNIPPYRCTTFWKKVGSLWMGSGGLEISSRVRPVPGGFTYRGSVEGAIYDASGKQVERVNLQGTGTYMLKASKGVYFLRTQEGVIRLVVK